MSIKDRLAKKTGDLAAPAAGPQTDPITQETRAPRTGPGQMLAYRTHMQENNQRVRELESQLSEFEGSLPARALDPKTIRPSKWANRHESNFSSADFAALKADIHQAGKNEQAIRVRPLAVVDGQYQYEIVFGHRRHQACLQLDIPVIAIIGDIGDRELFEAMDRENRARADLSPFEQGEMYRRALDEGLYPSLRNMADKGGFDAGNASKAIAIARLPNQVLGAFESPTQIQYRWGQELLAALQKDPDGVVERAKSIRFSAKQLPPAEVLDRLIGRPKPAQPSTIDFKQKGKVVGKFIRKADGSISLTLKGETLDDEAAEKLRLAAAELVAKK